jgi:hypothetical protein
MKNEASWSSVGRGLSDFSAEKLDNTDEVLMEVRERKGNEWPENSEDEEEEHDEEDEEEEEEEEAVILQLNVESIPFFVEPYHPPVTVILSDNGTTDGAPEEATKKIALNREAWIRSRCRLSV